MAHEPPIGAVIGQVDGAPGTGGGFPAVPADGHAAAAPAVEEQDALLPPADVLRKLLPEKLGQAGFVALAKLLLHVRQADVGQTVFVVSFR